MVALSGCGTYVDDVPSTAKPTVALGGSGGQAAVRIVTHQGVEVHRCRLSSERSTRGER
jgi:hypothetical protein